MNLYIHYKGGRYLMVGEAETHEHNGEKDAVYISLTHGKMVTRPLYKDSRGQDAWTDTVMWPDGIQRKRFTPAAMLTERELAACFGEQP
jgi:hypothetical protein